jgi:murein DD-endopeptidase MepM/ murein hydrolase activator NlpD
VKRLAPLLPLALSACIPPGAPPQSRVPAPSAPRIEPDVDTLNQERPVWEAHPAERTIIDVAGGTYTVQPGDTLHSAGLKTGVGWETLVRVNHLPPGEKLAPGMVLTVPPGRYHIVKAGESGIAIARAHGLHWSDIVTLNGLAEPYVIHTDQRLLLPANSAATTANAGPDTAMAARAAAFNLDDVVSGGGEPAQDAGAPPSHEKPTPQRPLAPTTAVREPAHFSDGKFGWPLQGNVVSRFGAGGNHGIDIAAPAGSIADASASGVVAFVGQVAGYGGTVILRHGEGWLSIYSHLARISLTRGAQIRRGAALGITGGSNLHFEIRQHRTPIDPMKKLA